MLHVRDSGDGVTENVAVGTRLALAVGVSDGDGGDGVPLSVRVSVAGGEAVGVGVPERGVRVPVGVPDREGEGVHDGEGWGDADRVRVPVPLSDRVGAWVLERLREPLRLRVLTVGLGRVPDGDSEGLGVKVLLSRWLAVSVALAVRPGDALWVPDPVGEGVHVSEALPGDSVLKEVAVAVAVRVPRRLRVLLQVAEPGAVAVGVEVAVTEPVAVGVKEVRVCDAVPDAVDLPLWDLVGVAEGPEGVGVAVCVNLQLGGSVGVLVNVLVSPRDLWGKRAAEFCISAEWWLTAIVWSGCGECMRPPSP